MLDLRELGIRQSQAEILSFHVDGTGTAEITEGKYLATLTDNGTGDHTITLLRPAYRTLLVIGVAPYTAHLICSHVSTSSTVRTVWEDVGATPTDCEYDIHIMAFYRAEQN